MNNFTKRRRLYPDSEGERVQGNGEKLEKKDGERKQRKETRWETISSP